MKRAYGEGDDPKDTVSMGGDAYRSTGLLHTVIQSVSRSGRRRTALLIDRGWFYADPHAYDRASGFIDEQVTVTWRLANGRRFVTSLDGAVAKGVR